MSSIDDTGPLEPVKAQIQAFRTTISLMNGQQLDCCVLNFSPFNSTLEVHPEIDTEAAERLAAQSQSITRDSVAYVGFHRQEGDPPLDPPDDENRTCLCVHTIDKGTFFVSADQIELTSPSGFEGLCLEPTCSYSSIYFFPQGIRAKEDPQRIGELLVSSGAITPDELARGVSVQTASRTMPIGEILMWQEKATAPQVEAALEHQQRKPGRLGEILIGEGIITLSDLEAALQEQKKTRGVRLGEVLMSMGMITEERLYRTLSRKFHLPFVNLDEHKINQDAIREVSLEVMDRYTILPIDTNESSLIVAIGDPLGLEAHDSLRFRHAKTVIEVVACPSQIRTYIEKLVKEGNAYNSNEVAELLGELEREWTGASGDDDTNREVLGRSDSAIARLVDQIILDAFRCGASDIHVEPDNKRGTTLVRFRVDGECSAYEQLPIAYWRPLVSRIKIMANLDIAERRRPQDGKLRFRLRDRDLELRVATIPTAQANEQVVLRLLSDSDAMPLASLEMSARNLRAFAEAVAKPYGLVLCVGPTGSGKTTTLHAALGSINDGKKKIWTAEDPVEITQVGLCQVQVNPKIGLTFADCLRSFLRADPDVIMVGEMRDQETAQTAVEASLTGHLVLSTLHTNSAPETVTRLLDMGLDPFIFSDALLGVLAQRLVRRLCSKCKKSRPATADEVETMVRTLGEARFDEIPRVNQTDELQLWNGTGCEGCRGTGYAGRLALHELLVPTESILAAIQQRQPAAVLRQLAQDAGMTTLLQDGVAKSLTGLTTLTQVMAVALR